MLPWPAWVRSETALRQVGAWARRLHDVTDSFVSPLDARWLAGQTWRPGLIIGHHDAAPWNVVWRDGGLAGFFDWDTAGPSTREFDLAFMALTWVPLHARGFAERTGFTAFEDRSRRLHLLLDAYGYEGDRPQFQAVVVQRARTNADVIRRMAAGGDPVYTALEPVAAASIRRPAKSTWLPSPSGCLRTAATQPPCLNGPSAPPALTLRTPTAPADIGRIEPLAGSPDPCHGRDTALPTAIRSTRRTLPAHRRRWPPATRGPYRRMTQGAPGWSPPAESRPRTRHRRRRAARSGPGPPGSTPVALSLAVARAWSQELRGAATEKEGERLRGIVSTALRYLREAGEGHRAGRIERGLNGR